MSLTSKSAIQAPTQFTEVNGRTLAYRQIGAGIPLLLCVRFRGTLDSWDPAFLDALAASGFLVTTFDYSGLGASTGERTYNPASLATDAIDLMDALGFDKVALGGWSIGGVAAQIAFAKASGRVSHLVLLGTTPPGELVKKGEPLFYTMAKRENDFDDIVALFFEPNSAESRSAAEESERRINARSIDRSPVIPVEWAAQAIGDGPRNPMFPVEAVKQALKATKIPVLHIAGSRDIVFPKENWDALAGEFPTLRTITMPVSGHGPHQQYPTEVAGFIASFVQHSGGAVGAS